MTKYYVNNEGQYTGAFEGETPPPGMGFDIEVPYPPEAGSDIWNFTEERWEMTDDRLREWLGDYRDSKIQGILTFAGIDITCDERSRIAVGRIARKMELDGEDLPIKWAGPNGQQTITSHEQAEGLGNVCFEHEQACFNAFDAVVMIQNVTPYEFIQDAKDDFDTALEG